MDFNEYQEKTGTTAVYPGIGTVTGIMYCALGLGEAGEVQGKVKKVLRDDGSVVTDEKRDAIKAELGDLLWYAAQISTELGFSLNDVAEGNIAKLADRAERGVLQGSGDTR